MNQELLRQSIKALETCEEGGYTDIDGDWRATQAFDEKLVNSHLTALRAAVAQPALQWCKDCGEGVTGFCRGKAATCNLFIAQPVQPAELSDEEVLAPKGIIMNKSEFIKAIQTRSGNDIWYREEILELMDKHNMTADDKKVITDYKIYRWYPREVVNALKNAEANVTTMLTWTNDNYGIKTTSSMSLEKATATLQQLYQIWPGGIDEMESAMENGWKGELKGDTSLDRFNKCAPDCITNPVERLRFFCSMAMNEQDWIDVEPLFEACNAALQPKAEQPTISEPLRLTALAGVGAIWSMMEGYGEDQDAQIKVWREWINEQNRAVSSELSTGEVVNAAIAEINASQLKVQQAEDSPKENQNEHHSKQDIQ